VPRLIVGGADQQQPPGLRVETRNARANSWVRSIQPLGPSSALSAATWSAFMPTMVPDQARARSGIVR
jgi:hypothetical protein